MVTSAVAYAQASAPQEQKPLQIFRSLDNKVSTLKEKALEINRDLIMIEEESFIPTDAQLVVFLSLQKKTPPKLSSVHVKLELDGELVAHHVYTVDEIEALHRGGIHRLYLGHLSVGEHELVARIGGENPGGQNFKTSAAVDFNKLWTRKYIELAMSLPEKQTTQPKVIAKEM